MENISHNKHRIFFSILFKTLTIGNQNRKTESRFALFKYDENKEGYYNLKYTYY